MSAARLILVFDDCDALIGAVRALRQSGVTGIDAHTPWHVTELDDLLDMPRSRVRPVMLWAGLAAGSAMLVLQWWNSTIGYPVDSGGRPLNSWPAFMFATFETGVLAAAFAGLLAFLRGCGLPRLNHPFFAHVATEAASDDGFLLSLPAEDAPDRLALERMTGALRIIEVGS